MEASDFELRFIYSARNRPKEHILNNLRALGLLLAVAAPLHAQYGGPAVLTRGQAPAPMAASQIDFRPVLSVMGGYDYGLNGVGVNPNGRVFNVSAYSIQATGGVSGVHSWRRTSVGLDYSASIRHFFGNSYYDGFDQRLLLSVAHQFSRHTMFSLRTNAGIATQNYNAQPLQQSVSFDPATTYVPTNDFFDNRTSYISTQADLSIQKSTRVSFNVGADAFATRRRSEALYGVKGAGARGDIMYRLSRRSTVGLGYSYIHYAFSRIFSSTDLHQLVGIYAVRLSRATELSLMAGASRFETKFIQSVPVDPAIAALIGLQNLNQISYSKDWISSGTGRLSYTMKRGVAFLSGGRAVTPGNGLFLTSTTTAINTGYTYTALKRWSASANAGYNRSNSLGNFIGQYGSYDITLNISRQVARFTHGVLTLQARKYQSNDFNAYNTWSYGARVGFGFSPGDLPLRLW
jgi:hypothetical protein